MNKAKTNYIAENMNLLANLTWKELETIYYLRIPSLKDYGKNLSNLPVSKPEDKSKQSSEKQGIKSATKLTGETDKKLAQPIADLDKPVKQISAPISTTSDTNNQPPAPPLELGIAQTIEKHVQDYVSTSPFAKLKSNSPAASQEPSLTEAVPQPPIKKVSLSEQSAQESNMESAWFIEPDLAGTKKSVLNKPNAEIQATPAKPDENSGTSLDTAIENAFGRMLKSPKKKTSRTDSTSKPAAAPAAVPPVAIPPAPPLPIVPITPAVPPAPTAMPQAASSANPKLLPYSTTAESTPIPKPTATPIESASPVPPPAFDFSPALKTGDNPKVMPVDTDLGKIDKPINVDESVSNDTYVSRDVLRDLIHNHIKHASGQGSDFAQGQSIGSGKEYEVWLNNPSRSKFIGGSKPIESASSIKSAGSFKPRVVPADIRKSCLILGLRPETLSYETVQDAWKKSIALPGVHPDQGGDTEMAVYLNTAKDTLIHWLDAQAPKLGKKFGAPRKDDTK